VATKLADDEGFLKKYDNLSRGEKQQLDLNKRQRLKEAQAEADAGDSFGQRAGDIAGRVLRGAASLTGSPIPAREQQEANTETAKRESNRQRRLQEAKNSANYEERGRTLYGSSTPGKLKDNPLPFKQGGSVSSRADGIAQRGKTKGRMC
jgi:hypothetical protein